MNEHFNHPPVVGQRVTGYTDAPTYSSTWSGVYLGIVRSDHDGQPIHLFVDGEINGIPQTSHGFPSGTDPAATLESSTAAVIAWHEAHPVAERPSPADHGKAAAADLVIDPVEEPSCPVCGSGDVGLWADDGESWRADYYECMDCKASGYVVHPDAVHPVNVRPARTMLVHLNVTVPASDTRTAEEIASVLMMALEVGLEGAEDAAVSGVGEVVMALAEEV